MFSAFSPKSSSGSTDSEHLHMRILFPPAVVISQAPQTPFLRHAQTHVVRCHEIGRRPEFAHGAVHRRDKFSAAEYLRYDPAFPSWQICGFSPFLLHFQNPGRQYFLLWHTSDSSLLRVRTPRPWKFLRTGKAAHHFLFERCISCDQRDL